MAVAVVLLCVIYILCFVIWKSVNRKGVKVPPLAGGGLPIVGHSLLLLGNKEKLYETIFETMLGTKLKEGIDAVTVKCGTWNIYVFMNPEDGYLLGSSCQKKDVIYSFFRPLFGEEGLLTADVPLWRKHRRILSPTFNQRVLDAYSIEFNQQSRLLVKTLEKEVGKGAFDHIPYVKFASLQSLCATAMGASADDEDRDIKIAYSKAYAAFTGGIVERGRKFWYHSNFLFGLSNLKRKQETLARQLHELSYIVLRKRKAELVKKDADDERYKDQPRFKPFLDHLLDLSKEGELTDSEIREEVHTFIAAGSDSTAFGISISLLNIGTYPEVQKKVFEELVEVFEGSDRDVERSDLSRLKYLEAVINETLRLYPVVIGVGRTLDKDLKFRDYTLPAGSRCWASIYNIGRHPVWGPDAEEFCPERWLDRTRMPENPNAFAAFGLGKRSCIGGNFAMMSMKTTLSHVLRRYQVTGDVTKLVQNIDIVARPIAGYHIGIERREK